MHLCDYTVSAYLSSIPPELYSAATPRESEIIKDFLKYELFGFIIDWLNHGMPDDVTDRVRTISATLSPIKFAKS